METFSLEKKVVQHRSYLYIVRLPISIKEAIRAFSIQTIPESQFSSHTKKKYYT